MCNGLAILANKEEVRFKSCNKNHSSIENVNMDDYLRFEIILDTTAEMGFKVEQDKDVDTVCIERYHALHLIRKDGHAVKAVKDRVLEWVSLKENQLEIFKCFAWGNMQKATIKGDQNNYSATIKGYQNNDYATIKGDQNNYSATIKDGQSNNYVTIKGDQSNDYATIKGDQNNDSATIKGDQNNDYATIKGKITFYKLQYGDAKMQQLLDDFSSACVFRSDATLENLIRYAVKNGVEI